MAVEPADVLIIGAGASGGVVALRLAEAGFKVVCLEQGEWLDRADYPGNKLDWELKARKDWATSPNIRGLGAGLPDRRGRHACLAAHVQRGRRLDDHLRGRLAARPPVRLPRPLARRHRRRLADRLLRAAAVLLPDRPRSSACRGCRATRPTRPTPRTRRCRRCPSGRPGSRSPAARRSSAGTGGPSSTRSTPSPTTGGARASSASTCQSGCNEGAKASTDLTHWPKAIALGARLVTGARVRRIETNAKGLATGATWIDTRRRRAFRAGEGRRAGGATRSARRGCCCSRRATAIRTASPTRPGSSGSG